MTDKELHRLRRSELLEILIEQKKAFAAAQQELAETEKELNELRETYERLRRKLDDKDNTIRSLRSELAAAREQQYVAAAAPDTEGMAALTARLEKAVIAAESAANAMRAVSPAYPGKS